METTQALKKSTWNTYACYGYTYDVANDQSSAGGVHLHQIRKGPAGWQTRIKQTNGAHASYSQVVPISDADGEARFETAKNY